MTLNLLILDITEQDRLLPLLHSYFFVQKHRIAVRPSDGGLILIVETADMPRKNKYQLSYLFNRIAKHCVSLDVLRGTIHTTYPTNTDSSPIILYKQDTNFYQ